MAATVPILLWAYEAGPDPGYTGLPSENGGQTCATSGCHTGTVNSSSNKGSVTVNFPNGLTYTPGVAQQVSVTIADPATTQRAWGFELTARVASATSTMAGTFTSTDGNTTLLCSQSNLQRFVQMGHGSSQVCASNYTLQYIEHSLGGYASSRGITGSYTYNFIWTPPATNVGNIAFYIAGNAANNDGNTGGDHIYSKSYILTPAATNTPAITAVVNAASFQNGVVPGSWFTIQGTNLASTTDTWDSFISNGSLPTSVDGVSVDVGGKAAYIVYVSPTQINAVAPDPGTGSVSVTVKNANGTSSAATAVSQAEQPGFFQWGNYVVATRADYSLAVKNGTFAGATTTPAKPGEVIILWGTGFGPTTPGYPAGVEVPSTTTYYTANYVTATVGGVPATVYGSALAPGFAGLYQIAIQVPTGLTNGDYPLVVSIAGAQSPGTTLLTVQP